MNNATRLRRLRRFHDLLGTVPEKHFEMDFGRCADGGWISPEWDRPSSALDHLSASKLDDVLRHGCGTAACALGWACTEPSFRRAGLRLNEGDPIYKKETGAYAGAEFFGIEHTEAYDLFYSHKYTDNPIKPAHVRAKIRRLIAKYEGATRD